MKVGTTVKQVTVEFNTLDDLDTACFVPGFAEAVKNIIEAEQSKAEKGEDASGQKGDVVAVEMYYAYPKDGDDPVIMHSNVYGDRVDHPTGLSDAEEEWEPYPVMNSDDEKTLPGVFASQRAETLPRTPLNHSATSRIS